MKAKNLKTSIRFEPINDNGLGIQRYGEQNDYPQKISEILDASGTGSKCVEVYAKFVSGKGFSNQNLWGRIVNNKRQTSDYIQNEVAKDYSEFGGIAIHVNYNANYQITELQIIPLEHVRFGKLDENGNFSKVAIHRDWGKRFTKLRKWKKDDIDFIDLFNPDPEKIQEQVDAAGGWQNYKGQVYYFSNRGDKCYPKPIYDSVLTDMSSEEGVANVTHRNVRNNFLSAGMLVDVVEDNDSIPENLEEGRRPQDQQTETEKALLDFQGDEEACKIMYVAVEDKEKAPVFTSFKGNNYDKEFTVTLSSSQANIGKRFSQPPILRAEDVGANFGADLMKNAYDFYNSVTQNERLVLERIFKELFHYWHEPIEGDFSILPLTYESDTTLADRIGKDNLSQIVSILNNNNLSEQQKKNYCKILFGLSDQEVNLMFITQNPQS